MSITTRTHKLRSFNGKFLFTGFDGGEPFEMLQLGGEGADAVGLTANSDTLVLRNAANLGYANLEIGDLTVHGTSAISGDVIVDWTAPGTIGSAVANTGTFTTLNVLSHYLNFSSTSGSAGFGIRDNSGVIEFKNQSGTWTAVGTSSGSVTADSGVLTSGSLVIGNGSEDIKTVAGFTTDGTSVLTLGVAGTSAGGLVFKNATSGTITINPPTGALGTRTVTLPSASTVIPVFSQQMTFAGPTAARTVTLPDASFTVARTDAANSFTGTQTVGALVATTVNGNTLTAGTYTITGSAGKTLSFANTLTFSGTDSSSIAFGAGGTVAYVLNKLSVFAATTSAELAGVISDETGTGSLVFNVSPTLVTPVLGVASATSLTVSGAVAAGSIRLNGALSTNNTYNGTEITGLNAGATLAQWDAVYVGGSSTWLKADADGSGTYPARGLAVTTGTSGNPLTVLTRGTVKNTSWSWTPGGTLYISTTAGGLTQTAPSTSGNIVQQVGYALTATVAYLEFNGEYITLT